MRPIEIDTVLLKTASRCNLDCGYCYVYHMGDEGWRDQPKRMSMAVIEQTVSVLGKLAETQTRPFSVCMHGGEPLLLGLKSTEALVASLRSALPDSCSLHVQTNGVLLTNDFIEVFARYGVGISISFDGPAYVHDKARPDRLGAGSYLRVRSAIERLRDHPKGAPLFSGVLAVVDVSADPEDVYLELKSTGAPGIDFLYQDGNWARFPPSKSSAESTEYGDWMGRILDLYVNDPSPPRIRVLDDMMRLILGGQAYKEGLGVTDFGILVIDTNGDVTKNDTLKGAHAGADRFTKPSSIFDDDLLSTIRSAEFGDYHDLQKPSSPQCLACPDLHVCGGGMPAHRWSEAGGFENPSIYCADQLYLIAKLRRYLAAAKAAA